jgi:hypothetical protein
MKEEVMGLDAVVYVHKSNLALNQKNDAIETDEQTGEVYFEKPELIEKYPASMLIAAHKRLGNASMIATIGDEISTIINDESILYKNVLYSGSHSGDIIGLECLDKLESEINLINERTANSISPALESFLGSMKELLRTAREQKNPIVFV